MREVGTLWVYYCLTPCQICPGCMAIVLVTIHFSYKSLLRWSQWLQRPQLGCQSVRRLSPECQICPLSLFFQVSCCLSCWTSGDGWTTGDEGMARNSEVFSVLHWCDWLIPCCLSGSQRCGWWAWKGWNTWSEGAWRCHLYTSRMWTSIKQDTFCALCHVCEWNLMPKATWAYSSWFDLNALMSLLPNVITAILIMWLHRCVCVSTGRSRSSGCTGTTRSHRRWREEAL